MKILIQILYILHCSAVDTNILRHPFHMHGFVFYVMAMGQPLGPITKTNIKMTEEYFKELDDNNQIERNFVSPPAKDTLPIPNNGYAILRFRANNPGNNF